MKITILAYHFPPEQVIAAIRPHCWAEWLSADHEVTVITRTTTQQVEKGNLPYKVIRPPSALMEGLRRFSTWRKSRKATQSKASKPPSKNADSPMETGILTTRMPSLCDVWIFAALRGLWQAKPDVIIATQGPYIALLAAKIYQRLCPGVVLWSDFRDLWSNHPRYSGAPGFRQLESWLEGHILRSSKVVTTVSQGLIQELQEVEPSVQPQLVYNCVSNDAESIPDELFFPEDETLRIAYTGSLYTGWQDPTPLIDLIKKLDSTGQISPEKLQLVMASINPGNMLELFAAAGVSEYLDFRGALTRSECIRLQRDADILVIFESPEKQDKGFLTGKVFEYLYSTHPILLVGPTPETELYKMVESHHRRIGLRELEQGLLEGKRSALFQPRPSVDSTTVSREQLQKTLKSLRKTFA